MQKEKDQVPPNIIEALKKYKPKLTGKPDTLKSIETRVNKLKEKILMGQSQALKRIKINQYKDGEGLVNKQIIRLSITGRKNTHYQYKKVKAFMLIPDGYPQVPPQVYFQQVRGKDGKWRRFNHLNVDPQGLMCQNINKVEMQYTVILELTQILEEVENLLYNVNPKSAYGGPLFDAYKGVDGGPIYQKALAAQCQLLEQASPTASDDDDDDYD